MGLQVKHFWPGYSLGNKHYGIRDISCGGLTNPRFYDTVDMKLNHEATWASPWCPGGFQCGANNMNQQTLFRQEPEPRSGLRCYIEAQRGVVCEQTQHMLEYLREVGPGRYGSKCSRCREVFVTSMPIGYGAPRV